MKKVLLAACLSAVMSGAFAPAALAQDPAQKAQNPSVVRDPDLEKESLHNLEVARHYFRLKKAYRAALARCEEIIAGDPTFSRLDEVLYLAAMSNLRLSEARGKQSASLPPEQLRHEAREYLTRLVTDYPDSDFAKRAKPELDALGGPATEGRRP
ncbi:MAG TPA: outer membrane protein assembly factor BamD [Pyrinomonadaceae bacterium]|nr:outer membrane protein assembly factor BamD [Pyrinomonadaceae bacterium]